MKLSHEDHKKMLYWMILGRRIEEKITLLFKEGRMRGHHHPGVGIEAVHVGTCYGLGKDDYIVPSHRGKLPELMMGVGLDYLLAGYYNRREGLGGGRVPTGSHMYGDMSKHVIPGSGIIGSLIPVATGAGLGIKLKKERGVVLAFFGDGGANRGDFHEGLNMAAAFKLPVVFVLQNNSYSISVSLRQSTGLTRLSKRAEGYGMPGVTVDGCRVLEVYEEAQKAIARARSGKGPTLLECMWHRWTGHSISDADVYRTDKERAEGEKRCPVGTFKKECIAKKTITKREYEEMERRAKEEIEEAVRYCEKECTDPDPADVLRGVYSQG
ncbi:MAG: thiamine pyrophosphate-dependent dehydrogenase E1 component subunit alpha [Spirochaetes bacterium]|nr:thiamine pyrophosphate-dependent dehydrogenase E1 component subunit alpha [Spirochaetota bacterium]